MSGISFSYFPLLFINSARTVSEDMFCCAVLLVSRQFSYFLTRSKTIVGCEIGDPADKLQPQSISGFGVNWRQASEQLGECRAWSGCYQCYRHSRPRPSNHCRHGHPDGWRWVLLKHFYI